MVHNNKAGIIAVAIGVVLILSALLLYLYNEISNVVLEQDTQVILEKLRSDIETHAAQTVQIENIAEESQSLDEVILPETEQELISEDKINRIPNTVMPINTEMTVRVIDGHAYIGYMEIPELDLALPIMADWNEEKLNLAPCRHFGSTKTDDLVIAGHNYKRHFAKLSDLEIDDRIRFIDMDGLSIEYSVEKYDLLKADEVWQVLNSEYDLILYTCDYTGGKRLAIFCKRE